jgi:hypothetical protein
VTTSKIRNLIISPPSALPFSPTLSTVGVSIAVGNPLGIVALPPVYQIVFDLKPTSSSNSATGDGTWRSVLMLSATGKTGGAPGHPGDRLPTVYFCGNSNNCGLGGLVVSYQAFANSMHFDMNSGTNALPINTWTTVTIYVDSIGKT